MSNVDNIKPYSDFAHKAAQHGGVDDYLNELEASSYDKGINDAHEKLIKNSPYILAGILLVWEGGKVIFKKGKKYFDNRTKKDNQKITDAKKAIKSEISIDDENGSCCKTCENRVE